MCRAKASGFSVTFIGPGFLQTTFTQFFFAILLSHWLVKVVPFQSPPGTYNANRMTSPYIAGLGFKGLGFTVTV